MDNTDLICEKDVGNEYGYSGADVDVCIGVAHFSMFRFGHCVNATL